MQVCQEDWGIEPPRLYQLGFDYNNCLAGETRFLTNEGAKTLKEMVSQEPFIMTTGGNWAKASIQSFGIQQLWEIRLKNRSHTKVIHATADHRWIAYRGPRSNNRVELLTHQLVPGTRLVSLFGRSLARVRPSAFGIAHGIVFGDGTRFSGRSAPASVVLCGAKIELLKYFPLSPTSEVASIGVRVNDLPRFFKDRPSLLESRSYLYGWLAGYFAADGKVHTDGSLELSSASYDHLLFVRDVCTRLGIGTRPISTSMRTGYGEEPTPLYSVRLQRNTIKEDFFISSRHRERALAHSIEHAAIPDSWTVVSVEPTSRTEEVYCAVVPDTHCFVLEDNILTGNCGGRCCRNGIKAWTRLAYFLPERFEACAAWEQAQREKGGARAKRSFAGRQVQGKKQPLPLYELRETYLPQAHRLLKLDQGASVSARAKGASNHE
jgi:DNA primase